MKRKTVYLGIIAVSIVAVVVTLIFIPKHHTIQIGNARVQVTLATTESAWEKGLSGTTSLKPNRGMLFVFPNEAPYQFWMKDMNYAIDIIWIDNGLKVVDIKEHARPDSYPESFTPQAAARFVLEVPDGFVAREGIHIGDVVSGTQ